jgi:hypothetical protein
LSVIELAHFSKSKLATSLLKLGPEDSKSAVEIWGWIRFYMGIRSSKDKGKEENITDEQRMDSAMALLHVGITKPTIRNEIYCQLCKQLTNDPKVRIT